MDDMSRVSSNRVVSINIEDDDFNQNPPPPTSTNTRNSSGCSISVSFVQKVILILLQKFFLSVIYYYFVLIYMLYVIYSMLTVDRRVYWNLLPNIWWLRSHHGEQKHGKCSDTSRNSRRVRTGGGGHDLLRWTYFWSTFESRCNHCFCHLQEVPVETGNIHIYVILESPLIGFNS